MAVPEGKRTESQLAFQTKAIELLEYTTTICNNNNIFPKRDRWMVANRIVDCAFIILECVFEANDVYVSTYDDYLDRRKIQQKAKHATSNKFLGFNYKLTDSGKVVMTVVKSNIKKKKKKDKGT